MGPVVGNDFDWPEGNIIEGFKPGLMVSKEAYSVFGKPLMGVL